MRPASLLTDVLQRHGRPAGDTRRAAAPDGPVLVCARRPRRSVPDLELHPLAARVAGVRDDERPDPRLLALLLAEPPRAHEWHLDPARRVRASHGPRPDPGDDSPPGRRPRASPAGSARRCAARASSRIHSPYARTSAASPVAPSQPPIRLSASPGNTGGRPANFGGISISALLISTATGLRSEACASRPRRWASSGIVPPPANGSRIGGGLPPVDLRISACASSSSA